MLKKTLISIRDVLFRDVLTDRPGDVLAMHPGTFWFGDILTGHQDINIRRGYIYSELISYFYGDFCSTECRSTSDLLLQQVRPWSVSTTLQSPAPVIRQPPSTDCSTCPLQHLRLSLLLIGWSYSLEFTAWQFSCWARPVSTDSENPSVCLLLAFRWQFLRSVFTYSRYTNVH